MSRIMITGCYGFIGSNLVRYWLDQHPEDEIIGVDCLTYAARPEWLTSRLSEISGHKFKPAHVDIRDINDVGALMRDSRPDHVIHLAAESHVCRSIEGPGKFVQTNIVGTFNLLETFRHLWPDAGSGARFHHVSTDEVYGEAEGFDFDEDCLYDPRSPYAASKAASDHLVRAWHHTYGLDVTITNCSNNFGPNQHEEKLIPKVIHSILNRVPMTVYGDGRQVRDWLWVIDHCRAIDTVFHAGKSGSTYCVGGDQQLTNIQIIDVVTQEARRVLKQDIELDLRFTNDRPTDDRRYAIDCSRLKSLGWRPSVEDFQENIWETVRWYADRMHRE